MKAEKYEVVISDSWYFDLLWNTHSKTVSKESWILKKKNVDKETYNLGKHKSSFRNMSKIYYKPVGLTIVTANRS